MPVTVDIKGVRADKPRQRQFVIWAKPVVAKLHSALHVKLDEIEVRALPDHSSVALVLGGGR